MTPRRFALIFFGINLLLACWYLDAGRNDNTLSRAATVVSIVEEGHLRIDAHEASTGDKAFIHGHWYSDKAPLPAFVVVPFWWCATALGAESVDKHGAISKDLLRLSAFLCGSVPFAAIILMLYTMLRAQGERHYNTLLAMLPIHGSFLFLYCSSYHGHLLGCALLFGAWIALRDDRQMLAGALAGTAVLSEFPLAFFPLAWALWLTIRTVRDAHQRPALVRFMIGGLPLLLVLSVFNYHLTGSILQLGYDHNVGYASGAHRFGLEGPSFTSLFGLTFSTYRGLFIYMPTLLLLPLPFLWRDRSHIPLWTTWAPALAVLLLIASTSMWWGGWAYGPRHLCAVGLFLLLPIISGAAGRPLWRSVFLGFATAGCLLSFLAKWTHGSAIPTEVREPITDLLLPAFLRGDFSANAWLVPLGAHPLWSVASFLFIFVGGILLLHRLERRIDGSHAPVLPA